MTTITTRISARLEAGGKPIVIDGDAPILLVHATNGDGDAHPIPVGRIGEASYDGDAIIVHAEIELPGPDEVCWPGAYTVAVTALPVLVQRRPGYIVTQGATAERRHNDAPNGGADSDEGWLVRALIVTPGGVGASPLQPAEVAS